MALPAALADMATKLIKDGCKRGLSLTRSRNPVEACHAKQERQWGLY